MTASTVEIMNKGMKYGLHYESVYGDGTEVTIRIPAASKKVHENEK